MAKMINLTGNSTQNANQALLHSVMVDETYLLVAAQVDDQTRKKILQFEYIDLAKLLPHDRVLQEDDQRLTLINRGGYTLFSSGRQ